MKFENGIHFQKDHLRNFLRQKGMKYTRQREAVWSAFRSLEVQHPSCAEIYDRSRILAPGLGWATVYRSLKWMKDLGIIVERHFGDGPTRFERSGRGLTHGHLVCRQCGRVMELKDEAIESFWKKAGEKYRFEISRNIEEGYGLCANAKEKLEMHRRIW